MSTTKQIKNITTDCKCGKNILFFVPVKNYLDNNFNVTVCSNCHSTKTNVSQVLDEKQNISAFNNKFTYKITTKPKQ